MVSSTTYRCHSIERNFATVATFVIVRVIVEHHPAPSAVVIWSVKVDKHTLRCIIRRTDWRHFTYHKWLVQSVIWTCFGQKSKFDIYSYLLLDAKMVDFGPIGVPRRTCAFGRNRVFHHIFHLLFSNIHRYSSSTMGYLIIIYLFLSFIFRCFCNIPT